MTGPPSLEPGMFVRRALALSLVLATTLTGGCASLGMGGGSAPLGLWTGFIEVEGQRIDGQLEIREAGPGLTATFRAPSFDLVAEGEGSVGRDGLVSLRLDYDLQCPGEARLEGPLEDSGDRFRGRLAAGDCTGEVSGSFDFRRISTERP